MRAHVLFRLLPFAVAIERDPLPYLGSPHGSVAAGTRVAAPYTGTIGSAGGTPIVAMSVSTTTLIRSTPTLLSAIHLVKLPTVPATARWPRFP
jgi:hypothetical protein